MYICIYVDVCIYLRFYYTYANAFFHHTMSLLDLHSQKLAPLLKIYSDLWRPS